MKILFFILFPFCLKAQTRYFFAFQQPLINPAPINSGWNNISVSDTMMLTNQRSNIAVASFTGNNIGHASPWTGIVSILISPPLQSQTINGTFYGQLTVSSTSALPTYNTLLYLRLLNQNGSIASELGTSTSSTGTGTTNTNRQLSAITLTNVQVTTGQRFAMEIGWNVTGGTNTGVPFRYNRGNNRAIADLSVGDGGTASLNPWFEFSQNIQFQNTGFF